MKKSIQDYVINNIHLKELMDEAIGFKTDVIMDTPQRGMGNFRGYYQKFSVLEQIFFLSYQWKINCPIEDFDLSMDWSDWLAFFAIQSKHYQKDSCYPLLRPQYKYNNYKIDFVIIREFCKIAIELDGFAYHDRNKDQFTYERNRQNELVQEGFIVLRYTWQDVTERFDDVFYSIMSVLETKQKEYYLGVKK
jgi:hypothetical protein